MPSGVGLVASACLPLLASAASVYPPTPNAVKYDGSQLMVDGAPFFMQGVCYSPVPTGETVEKWPFGDYFTADYAYMWKRDLPLIKATGANVIRTYGWLPERLSYPNFFLLSLLAHCVDC